VGGVKQERSIHNNSLEAYWQGRVDEFSKREREILALLKATNGCFTDREIKVGLGYTDSNSVRPRISELIDRGVLEEWGNVYDGTTRKRVRKVRLVGAPQQTLLAI